MHKTFVDSLSQSERELASKMLMLERILPYGDSFRVPGVQFGEHLSRTRGTLLLTRLIPVTAVYRQIQTLMHGLAEEKSGHCHMAERTLLLVADIMAGMVYDFQQECQEGYTPEALIPKEQPDGFEEYIKAFIHKPTK